MSASQVREHSSNDHVSIWKEAAGFLELGLTAPWIAALGLGLAILTYCVM
jgi:hypothetical protein